MGSILPHRIGCGSQGLMFSSTFFCLPAAPLHHGDCDRPPVTRNCLGLAGCSRAPSLPLPDGTAMTTRSGERRHGFIPLSQIRAGASTTASRSREISARPGSRPNGRPPGAWPPACRPRTRSASRPADGGCRGNRHRRYRARRPPRRGSPTFNSAGAERQAEPQSVCRVGGLSRSRGAHDFLKSTSISIFGFHAASRSLVSPRPVSPRLRRDCCYLLGLRGM